MKSLLVLCAFLMTISVTTCLNTSSATDWLATINTPGTVPCPTSMGGWTNCYVRNETEAQNIQPLCEQLIFKSTFSSMRTAKICKSLGNNCKAPAVLVIDKSVNSGLFNYHITCMMFDTSVLAAANDGIVYGFSCRYTVAGFEYYGTLDTTATGKKCERWDAGLGHMEAIIWSNTLFAETEVINDLSKLGNKCRNYVIKSAAMPRQPEPWCYTSTSWELCNPPYCADRGAVRNCKSRKHGIDYTGTINVTNIGSPCIPWQNYAAILKDPYYPDGSALAASNYCRNPLAKDHLFCLSFIIVNSVQTATASPCNIPDC